LNSYYGVVVVDVLVELVDEDVLEVELDVDEVLIEVEVDILVEVELEVDVLVPNSGLSFTAATLTL